jgi:hypothetical protein
VPFPREYVGELEAEIAELRDDLAPLEAGTLRLQSRTGSGPWIDTTTERIAELKKSIALYERILAHVRQNGAP